MRHESFGGSSSNLEGAKRWEEKGGASSSCKVNEEGEQEMSEGACSSSVCISVCGRAGEGEGRGEASPPAVCVFSGLSRGRLVGDVWGRGHWTRMDSKKLEGEMGSGLCLQTQERTEEGKGEERPHCLLCAPPLDSQGGSQPVVDIWAWGQGRRDSERQERDR